MAPPVILSINASTEAFTVNTYLDNTPGLIDRYRDF